RMLLRAAVLALHAALLAALRPGDPNVCSYWERLSPRAGHRDTGGAVPAQAVPSPWRTGQHSHGVPWWRRVLYRTEYRLAVRTDYRRRYQCCQGYYESRDSCVPHCSQECVHGRCVAPEMCQCEPGWHGPDCSLPCPAGTWGPGCNRSCDCAHGAPCDPQSGTCHCPPGWQGPQCLQPCPGSWGRGCLMSCSCRNGASCSPQDGSCTCTPGFRGPSCQRRE
uniref:MEG11 protein n=1 Tax=Junco hyemalis TaxID=40217 RepID=A0A8C5NPF6_JUNHY